MNEQRPSTGAEQVTPPGHAAKYAVISPVRNEAQYIELTLKAMTSQTLPPNEWIIVDDCSTDETAQIVEKYAREHAWLKLARRERREGKADRQRGKGVIDAFYFGVQQLADADYQFIIKLDGDVSFEPNYFEYLIEQFASNPCLGIAGGGMYERSADGAHWSLKSAGDHVGGPAKMYRRTCFEDIGGLMPALGWDGVDEWQALYAGWEVRSFAELKFYHYRVMGNATGPLKAKIEQGYGAHAMGYHPFYLIARGIRHMLTPPYIAGGLAMIGAYFQAALQRREQLMSAEVMRYLRRTQLRQLLGGLMGKRMLRY